MASSAPDPTGDTSDLFRPALIYWVTRSGLIMRVESVNTDSLELSDHVFSSSFPSQDIVGTNLFRFINGRQVRHIYRALNARVLQTGRDVTFTYRCDSPGIRREMNMRLSLDGDAVRYESTVLRETPRTGSIPNPTSGSSLLVPMCSFCKSYRFPADSRAWKPLEDVLLESDLPEIFDFSHGVCEDCYRNAMQELAR